MKINWKIKVMKMIKTNINIVRIIEAIAKIDIIIVTIEDGIADNDNTFYLF